MVVVDSGMDFVVFEGKVVEDVSMIEELGSGDVLHFSNFNLFSNAPCSC